MIIFSVNLSNLKSSRSPSRYYMLKNLSQLNSIFEKKAYTDSDQYLMRFFRSQGMTNLPTLLEFTADREENILRRGSYLLLDQPITSVPNLYNFDEDTTWANVSLPVLRESPEKNQVALGARYIAGTQAIIS